MEGLGEHLRVLRRGRAGGQRDLLRRARAYAQAALRDYQHYQGRAAADEADAQGLLADIAQALGSVRSTNIVALSAFFAFGCSSDDTTSTAAESGGEETTTTAAAATRRAGEPANSSDRNAPGNKCVPCPLV